MALLLVSTLATGCEAFVQPQYVTSSSTQLYTDTVTPLPDLSEVLDGQSCVDPAAKEFFDSPESPMNGVITGVASFAPPLTYDKYLTMQVSF